MNITNKSNASITFDFFISKGYSPAAAAGIVGNLQAESGINPTRKQMGGGTGMGIAQWETSRWDVLTKWANGRGLNPLDLMTQLQYIDHELKSMDKRGAIDLNKFKSIDEGTEATRIFMKEYERPSVERFAERVEAARSIGVKNKVKFDYRPAGVPLSNMGDSVSDTTIDPNLTVAENKTFKDIQKKVTDKAGITGLNAKEQEILRKKYGYAWQIFANDETGSLFALLARAIKLDYTPNMFIAELPSTQWAKRRDANQEAYYLEINKYRNADGTFQPEYTNQLANIKDKIRREVLKVTGQLINPDDYESEILKYWEDNYNQINDPTKLNNFVKGLFTKKFEQLVELGGTIGDDQDEIRSFANSYGVSLSDNESAVYARKIALGETDINSIYDTIKLKATQLYPQFKKAFADGSTLDDVTAMYKNNIQTLMGIPSASININDNKGAGRFLKQALNYMDAEGKPSIMPLSEFSRVLRSSEDYQYTEDARDKYLDLGTRLVRKITGLSA